MSALAILTGQQHPLTRARALALYLLEMAISLLESSCSLTGDGTNPHQEMKENPTRQPARVGFEAFRYHLESDSKYREAFRSR